MKLPELEEQPARGIIPWLAKNFVTPTLLMLLLGVGGLFLAWQSKQEVYPRITTPTVWVYVAYPGASPEDVEQTVLQVLEVNIRSVEGVGRLVSYAYQGSGMLSIFLNSSTDTAKVFQDVKNTVDRIVTFPSLVEKPAVYLSTDEPPVISLLVHGKQQYSAIRSLAERVRSELSLYRGLQSVRFDSVPAYEISVEVPTTMLRKHSLTLDTIASTIRDSALDIPAGEVRTSNGQQLRLRTRERRDYGSDFEQIPITTGRSGVLLKLGDIATIRDGFEDIGSEVQFNGQPAIMLQLYSSGVVAPGEISRFVRSYIGHLTPELPADTRLQIWRDSTRDFDDRLGLLQIDMCVGLLLILALLSCFLEVRLAIWATLCIPIAMFGSFFLLGLSDVSINMISVFAFAVSLVIVIDLAVVVAEAIYRKREEGRPLLHAAQEGVRETAPPILLASLTNGLLLLPMLKMPGVVGSYFSQIPPIAIAVLAIALVEVLLILPAQLAQRSRPNRLFDLLNRPKLILGQHFNTLLVRAQIPIVHFVLSARVPVIAGAVVLLCGAAFLGRSEYLEVSFGAYSQAEVIDMQAMLPPGSSAEDNRKVVKILVEAANAAVAECGENIFDGVYSQIYSQSGAGASGNSAMPNSASASIALIPLAQRSVSATAFAELWVAKVGSRPEIAYLSFTTSGTSSNSSNSLGSSMQSASSSLGLTVELSHPSYSQLRAAALELAQAAQRYPGVASVYDGLPQSERQLDLKITPAARSLGISPSALAGQLRSAFYGVEALRQQRGRNEVRVMVRLPMEERITVETLDQLPIQSPVGEQLLLSQATSSSEQASELSIERQDGNRILRVFAYADDSALAKLRQGLASKELPKLLTRYPGLLYTFGDQQTEENTVLRALLHSYIPVLLIVYTLLASAFQSYLQAMIVIFSIPFAIIGAIAGHVIMGYEFNIGSTCGVLALCGILVNSSILMLFTANRLRARGFSVRAAIREAEIRRFRPILLTSITTLLCVTPVFLDTTLQGRALAPMATSIGFGTIFSAAISIGLIPALYFVIERARARRQALHEARR